MEFADQLPDGCPPTPAIEVASERQVYRLTESKVPVASDFTSHWHLYPKKRNSYKPNECKFRALSVWTAKTHCEKALLLPALKGRFICRLTLSVGDGMILEQGQTGHISWWVAKGINPLHRCAADN